jgi:Tol biopolymer transport system component
MAQPFRTSNLSIAGDPFPAAQGLAVTGLNAGAFAAAQFSVSATGTLVYQTGGARSAQLAWFDRAGKLLANAGSPGTTSNPDLSPDGKRIVFDGAADLWVLDVVRGASSRFTFNGLGDLFGTWSPDGKQIAFGDNRKGRTDLFVKPATGVGAEQLLLSSDEDKVPDDWSRDSRLIVFESFSPKTKYDLWWLPLDGDHKPVPYLQTEFNEAHARLSPDGKWLAYASDETGRSEIYVQRFPAPTSGKSLVSSGGGDQPGWRKDGKELFFLAPDRKLMSVDVKTGAALELGAPKPLFQTDAPPSGAIFRNHYVPSADGQKFLVVTVPPEQSAAPLVVVLNWAPRK